MRFFLLNGRSILHEKPRPPVEQDSMEYLLDTPGDLFAIASFVAKDRRKWIDC
jgi:hypothetical protein